MLGWRKVGNGRDGIPHFHVVLRLGSMSEPTCIVHVLHTSLKFAPATSSSVNSQHAGQSHAKCLPTLTHDLLPHQYFYISSVREACILSRRCYTRTICFSLRRHTSGMAIWGLGLSTYGTCRVSALASLCLTGLESSHRLIRLGSYHPPHGSNLRGWSSAPSRRLIPSFTSAQAVCILLAGP